MIVLYWPSNVIMRSHKARKFLSVIDHFCVYYWLPGTLSTTFIWVCMEVFGRSLLHRWHYNGCRVLKHFGGLSPACIHYAYFLGCYNERFPACCLMETNGLLYLLGVLNTCIFLWWFTSAHGQLWPFICLWVDSEVTIFDFYYGAKCKLKNVNWPTYLPSMHV